MLTYRNFVAALIDSFPELRSTIEDEERRIATLANTFPKDKSIRVDRISGWFSRSTQSRVDRDHRDFAARCLRFADEALSDADQYMRNAILVAYLCPLDLTQHFWAHQLMPPGLRKAYREVRDYAQAYFGELLKLGV